MKTKNIQSGFSLTEMLLAIGTLAVGMLLIAGAFPVAIHFAARSSEQSIASAVADEAFATIKLYAEGDPDDDSDDIKIENLSSSEMRPHMLENSPPPYISLKRDILFSFGLDPNIIPDEFYYPSTNISREKKHYYWTPMLRRVGDANDSRLVQVTIFVCRRPDLNAQYFRPGPELKGRDIGKFDFSNRTFKPWAQPIKVDLMPVQSSTIRNEMVIQPSPNENLAPPGLGTRTFINNGDFIVDDKTGAIYRVLRRYKPTKTDPTLSRRIKLDRDWQETDPPSPPPFSVWVIPPPSQGGRSPCIGVFQKLIRF